jgi:hypothetical protein
MTPDLRLAAPALAAWITAALTIGFPPVLTWTVAAITTITALYLLTTARRTPPIPEAAPAVLRSREPTTRDTPCYLMRHRGESG